MVWSENPVLAAAYAAGDCPLIPPDPITNTLRPTVQGTDSNDELRVLVLGTFGEDTPLPAPELPGHDLEGLLAEIIRLPS